MLPPVNEVSEIRRALPTDSHSIADIYRTVYRGRYPNALMNQPAALADYLAREDVLWVVACAGAKIVGSVVHEIDDAHRLCRVFGGVVRQEYRGSGLLERTMRHGQDMLMDRADRVDVIYATTRTASPAPQIVTRRMGYVPLGIFPNARRTDVDETHCLAAFYAAPALRNRFTELRLHPRLARLFDLVREQLPLPSPALAGANDLMLDEYSRQVPIEPIFAEAFVSHRFASLRAQGLLASHFFPFHQPNMMLTSPCQMVEVFAHLTAADKACTVVAVRKPRDVNLTWLAEACFPVLRDRGVRTVELLVHADKPKTIERVLRARFIPCAYVPAFQMADGFRRDFVSFNRVFDMPDFRGLRLDGRNREFLDEYLRGLDEYYLTPRAEVSTQ